MPLDLRRHLSTPFSFPDLDSLLCGPSASLKPNRGNNSAGQRFGI